MSPDLNLREARILQDGRVLEGHVVRTGARVRFELARYNHSRPLVIDPVLAFATFANSGYQNAGVSVAADAAGNAYVLGTTYNGVQIFVSKLNAAGNAVIYSTYLTASAFNTGAAIAVDAQGSAYIAANIRTGSFPIPAPSKCNGFNTSTVAARLSPDGASLEYATFICSSLNTQGAAIALDSARNVYVATNAYGNDVTPLVNPLQPQHGGPAQFSNPFVAKLDPSGNVIYSTYLGGSSNDVAFAIAADPAGNAYLTGSATSADFPVKGALQANLSGNPNAFAAKISADGSALVYSTYLGGSNQDIGRGIAADSAGNAYIAGSTFSADFPSAHALQPQLAGSSAFKSADGGATWSRSDTGLGGSPSAMVVDPKSPSTVYAVVNGRPFQSLDRAATWKVLTVTGFTSLAVGPDSALYAGQGNRVLRSTDGGQTWPVVYTIPFGVNSHVAVHPKNGTIVYAGFQQGNDGLYKSTDGGDTWNPTGFVGGGRGVSVLALDPQDTSTLYVCSNAQGCNRSVDGGATWAQSHAAGSTSLFSASSLLVDPVTSANVYAVQYSAPAKGGVIFVSTDHGATFGPAGSLPAVNVLAADPAHSGTLYAGTVSGVYRSTDSAATWQPANLGMSSSNILSLATDPQSGTLYAGADARSDGFVTKLSADGSTIIYSTFFGGSGADSVQSIVTDAAGDAYLAGSTTSADLPSKDGFRTSDGSLGFAAKFDPAGGLLWSSQVGAGVPSSIALATGAVYLGGTSNSNALVTSGALQPLNTGNFFTTANGGASWSASFAPRASEGPYAIAADPKTPSRVLLANAGNLYQSMDSGGSWAQIPTPNTFVKLVAIDPVSPATIYIACSSFATDGMIFKSTDAGATWNAASNGLATTADRSPNVLIIDPKTPSNVYLATNAGIYKTTDGGTSWQRSGNLGDVFALAIDPQNPSNLFASAPNIFRTTNGGATWTSVYQFIATALLVDPVTPQEVYGSIGTQFFRSDNGGQSGSWNMISTVGLPTGIPTQTALLSDVAGQALYLAPGSGGIYKSTDRGMNWTVLPPREFVNAMAADPFNPSHLYAAIRLNIQGAFVMKLVE